MKNLLRKSSIIIISIVLLMTISACDDSKKEQEKIEPISEIDLSRSSKSENLLETIEDPDLQLSIEELREKYPIDWLKEKYGDQDQEFCTLEGEYPVPLKWPCGPICDKYPNVSDCPVRCYTKDKIEDVSDNLICSFFGPKRVDLDLPPYSRNISVPIVKFQDFSIEEIKSAFLEYNYKDNAYAKKVDRKSIERDSRVRWLVVAVFVHFLNTPEELLNSEEKQLRSFIFSKKINFSLVIEDNCHYMAYLINPLEPRSQRGKKFCHYFSN